jgi:GrpB-like predicted nucleotidyltransferase (UPF0157 family)/uncharacterized protein YhfF
MTESAMACWQSYLSTLAANHPHRQARPDAFSFGDSPALADELGALVSAGRKRATASLPVEFTSVGDPLPAVGDVGIVLSGGGVPIAIIELVEVRHLPFRDVDAAFAADEGEGDATLASWRAAHLRYFGRVAARAGVRFDEETAVICQRFRLVWTGEVTHDGKAWSNAAEDRVELVVPDPSWLAQYEAEASALLSVLASVKGLRIEHFGSTAIPNLRAKPIIDILVIHPEPVLWPGLVEPLTSAGYAYWSGNPRKDRMFFVKGMPPHGTRRTHHVHVRLPRDAEAELAFRDLLRADPALLRRYELLKEGLAARFPNDRDAYTEGKAEFVATALGQLAKR